jgi:hypothetical protein
MALLASKQWHTPVPSSPRAETRLASKPWHTAPPRSLPGSYGAHPAVCRVIVDDRGPSVSYGSGTLVGVDQTLGLVVTNWHVVCDAAGPIMVVFPDGFRSTATVLATDRNWDLAALAIRRPPVEPIALATEIPRRGDPLTIAGYGPGSYKASTGRCTQYVSPGFGLPFEMVELDTPARQGDSGGPMLNRRGELAGVLFGTGFGRTAGSHCGRVRRFLDTVASDFERLSCQSTMIAQRPPPAYTALGTTAGLPGSADTTVGQANRATRRLGSAPIAAITGGPYRLTPEDGGRQPSPRRDLAELPVPRPYEPPADVSGGGGTAASPGSAGSTFGQANPGPRYLPSGRLAPQSQPAAPSRAEQIKTILAGIGILAVLFHALRLLGAAAGS